MILTSFGHKLAAICWFIACISGVGMLVLYLNYEEHANADLILIVGFSVFSALLSTSVTVYLFDVALRKETDTRLTETVSNAVEKSVRNSLNIRSSGLKSVHDSFDRDVFCGSAKSSDTMFILQTYAPNLTGIRPAVIDLLNRGGACQATHS